MSWTVAHGRCLAVSLVFVLAGCDSLTGNKASKIELTSSAPTANVSQGASSAVTLFIARTNFKNTVTLSIEGAPAYLTANISPTTLANGVNSATLTVTASGVATPGTTTLTVHAAGDGVEEQTLPVDVTVGTTGTFALSLLESSVNMAQDGAAKATVIVSRFNNNAGNVTIVPSGVPAGVTAVVASSPTTGSSTAIEFTTSGSPAPGTYPISITGSQPGFPDQNAALSLVVIAPPASASVDVVFCADGVPGWFAYRNDGYGWQTVNVTGHTFTFNATDHVTIAFVHADATETLVSIFSAARAEIGASNDRDCSGPIDLTGSIAGLNTGQTARVAMGTAAANIDAAATTGFSLTAVNDRTLDLVAARGTLSNTTFVPDRMIVRRSLDLADGTSIPVLDFGAAESFAPASNTLTLTGTQATDAVEMQNTFWSNTSTFGTAQTAVISGGTTTLYSVPAGQQVAGDVHELYVDAYTSTSSAIDGHDYAAYFAAPSDRTDALGALVGTPTLNTIATAPYARVRGRSTALPEYASSIRFGYFQQPATGPSRTVVVGTSAGFVGGAPATWEVVIPDFGILPGFSQSWMLAPNQPTGYYVEAFGGRPELLFGAMPVDGDLVRFSYHVSQAFTSQLRAATAMLHSGVPQYLRR